jgi:hypothetical protein
MRWPLPDGFKDLEMGTTSVCKRHSPRRACRGEVSVHRLAGGPVFKARLADIGGGGVRLCTDEPLVIGEVVQLVFPTRANGGRRHGRTIIGHVVHSSVGLHGLSVGIEFGWAAASPKHPSTHRFDSPLRSIFGLFSRKRKPVKARA